MYTHALRGGIAAKTCRAARRDSQSCAQPAVAAGPRWRTFPGSQWPTPRPRIVAWNALREMLTTGSMCTWSPCRLIRWNASRRVRQRHRRSSGKRLAHMRAARLLIQRTRHGRVTRSRSTDAGRRLRTTTPTSRIQADGAGLIETSDTGAAVAERTQSSRRARGAALAKRLAEEANATRPIRRCASHDLCSH